MYGISVCLSVTFLLCNKLVAVPAPFFTSGMGTSVDPSCDDAQTDLYMDWDYSPWATKCGQQYKWPVLPYVQSWYYVIPNFDPKRDKVFHACMKWSLVYDEVPPLRGNHRPLWAKYGEYSYLPSQRWLHNMEHGAIIMLYHPCADDNEVNRLRRLLTSCMYRHIITPYNKLSFQRPLALVSWGAKLEMNYVDERSAIWFIKTHARNSPEELSKEGQYDYMLWKSANIVQDVDDTVICPSYNL